MGYQKVQFEVSDNIQQFWEDVPKPGKPLLENHVQIEQDCYFYYYIIIIGIGTSCKQQDL